MQLLQCFISQGFPVHLPTFVARMLAFKLTIDTSKLPAVGDLVRSLARLLLGGDRSAWDRALLMPHYAAAGMPLLSSLQVGLNGNINVVQVLTFCSLLEIVLVWLKLEQKVA
jgi:hypothetical protein